MIDVSQFERHNVADSCALWNLLASRLLYSVARAALCTFCCTDYVRYECLHKRRTAPSADDNELKDRFAKALAKGDISAHHLDIADLQEVAILRNRKRLSMGEISSVAFAIKTRQAFLTDDQKARKLGVAVMGRRGVQTTPHLLGWLVFSSKLADGETLQAIAEHDALGRPLKPHFERAYQEALRCRLMNQSQ